MQVRPGSGPRNRTGRRQPLFTLMTAVEDNPTQPRIAVLMFTDAVDSVSIKSRLGLKEYGRLIARHDALFRRLLGDTPGATLIQDTGDGFYAEFATASDAVTMALRFRQALDREEWESEPPQVRIGLHAGQMEAVRGIGGHTKRVGLAPDIAARVTALAEGGQILVTRHVFDDARLYLQDRPLPLPSGESAQLAWMAHGTYGLKGYGEPLEIFEVGIKGLSPLRAPRDCAAGRRSTPPDEEELLGWRPATGAPVPFRAGWMLERKLGEGGMGEVWVGHHAKLQQRRVFKFCFVPDMVRSLKRELVLFRFIRNSLGERHDIAQLLDVHLDSPPHFLEAEFSEHGDLVTWAQSQGGIDRVPLATRLEILAGCAEALAAAHSVGVLHKDIKPSNVLIEMSEGGRLQPKLADFGIGELTDPGKLAAAGLTEGTLTEHGPAISSWSLPGTRLYVPPETLTGEAFSVRGDIYALGVMFYQLVTGDLRRPLAQGWERHIDDELLREDIARCVDGDPRLRFASAAELAERLHALEHRRAERELAKRQVAHERQRQRRLRVSMVVATALAIVATGVTVSLLRERDLRLAAVAAMNSSEREAARTRAVSDFLKDMLASANPENTHDGSAPQAMTVRELLDRAASRLEGDSALKPEPAIEAVVRHVLANTYKSLGYYDQALKHLREALRLSEATFGEDNENTLGVESDLAIAYASGGDYRSAEPLFRKVYEWRRKKLGEENHDTLVALGNLATLYAATGELDKAEPLQKRVVEIKEKTQGFENPSTLLSKYNLGVLYEREGLYAQAERLYRGVYDSSRHVQGEDHIDTIDAQHSLAVVAMYLGRYDESESLFRDALERYRRLLGDAHPGTLRCAKNLSDLYLRENRLTEAEDLAREVLSARRARLGAEHPDTIESMVGLAHIVLARGRGDDALELAHEAAQLASRTQGPNHPLTLAARTTAAQAMVKIGHYAAAETELLDVHQRARAGLGDANPQTTEVVGALVDLYDAWERPGRARQLFASLYPGKPSP